MARIARVVVPGFAYHVTHRGNRRAQIFFEPTDKKIYSSLLCETSLRYGLDLWGYCLMTNHVHLLVVGREKNSLAKAIGIAHQRYSLLLNKRYGWTGHLWANRYYSSALDGEHLWAAIKYIELNPVRAGIVADATEYPWSSARAHAQGQQDELLSVSSPFPGVVDDWQAWLECGLEPGTLERLRRRTSTGRPCGSEQFVRTLEKRLDRRLLPQARGGKGGPRSMPSKPA